MLPIIGLPSHGLSLGTVLTMRGWALIAGIWIAASSLGCSAIPDIRHQPQYHNPFPQLHRVAILPFFNLSEDAYVDGERVALLYYEELQSIPGFEVVPLGVVKRKLEALQVRLDEGTDFQQLARDLGVEVLLVGGVTDYSPYYPPRMGLSVRWFAANRGFHPIPPGYGLPWGTAGEKKIPSSTVWEAEFALAREQLRTQTPDGPEPPAADPAQDAPESVPKAQTRQVSDEELPPPNPDDAAQPWPAEVVPGMAGAPNAGPPLPPDWPDPSGLIPPPPAAERPMYLPQYEPIIRHTRIYHGSNEDFTRRLADYYYFRDDARFGGWQEYLERSDDFVRFCCYLHITETLAARGGVGEPRVVWRWPISRYDR